MLTETVDRATLKAMTNMISVVVMYGLLCLVWGVITHHEDMTLMSCGCSLGALFIGLIGFYERWTTRRERVQGNTLHVY